MYLNNMQTHYGSYTWAYGSDTTSSVLPYWKFWCYMYLLVKKFKKIWILFQKFHFKSGLKGKNCDMFLVWLHSYTFGKLKRILSVVYSICTVCLQIFLSPGATCNYASRVYVHIHTCTWMYVCMYVCNVCMYAYIHTCIINHFIGWQYVYIHALYA